MTKEAGSSKRPELPDARKLCPVAAAIAHYRRHGSRKFKQHLYDHLVNGYVISTPSLFAMFKAVAFENRKPETGNRKEGEEIVAWYVTYAHGDVRALLSLAPFPLPYIAFRRLRHGKEKLRVYDFERFRRFVIRHSLFVISRIP